MGKRGLLVATGAGVLTSLVVLVSTRHGIGANGTDSVAYLTMADDVAAGRLPYPTVVGVPATHLPPGWSVVVGAISAVLPGAGALSAARGLNVVLAGLLPVAVFMAVRARASRPTWLAPLLALVIATSYPLIELASRAIVEALFLVLLVATLLAIDRLDRLPSRQGVALATGLLSALTIVRFVGAAALVPLVLVVWTTTATWRQRMAWSTGVAAIALSPTIAWYLLAPGSLENAHLRGDRRAGLAEAVHSVEEAGITLVRGEFLPSVVQLLVGVALLSAPAVAVLVTGRMLEPERPWRPRSAALVRTLGLGPWLWFLGVYTVLVVIQRWDIDREVISRYWLPYWVVTVVVLGRCLSRWSEASGSAARRVMGATAAVLVALAAYNLAEVAVFTRDNARDGVTLNALRYQRSAALDALAEGAPSLVLTDHVQLAELQLYARDALVPIERVSCRVEAVDTLVARVERAQADGVEPAIALLRRCRDGGFTKALLAALDGAEVVREPGIGVVIRPIGR